MLDQGLPNASPGPDEDEEEDAAPPPLAMESMTPEQAEKLEKEAAARAAAAAAADAPVGDDQLRAFKEKARKEIEERLVDKRKRRRLMKGGNVSDTHRSL